MVFSNNQSQDIRDVLKQLDDLELSILFCLCYGLKDLDKVKEIIKEAFEIDTIEFKYFRKLEETYKLIEIYLQEDKLNFGEILKTKVQLTFCQVCLYLREYLKKELEKKLLEIIEKHRN